MEERARKEAEEKARPEEEECVRAEEQLRYGTVGYIPTPSTLFMSMHNRRHIVFHLHNETCCHAVPCRAVPYRTVPHRTVQVPADPMEIRCKSECKSSVYGLFSSYMPGYFLGNAHNRWQTYQNSAGLFQQARDAPESPSGHRLRMRIPEQSAESN